MSGSDDYPVGYKKPPVHTRFGQPGGNPRRRGGRVSRNLATDLRAVLDERVPVTANGKRVHLTQQRAVLKALAVAGIKGNVSAGAKLIELGFKILGADAGLSPPADLSVEDQEILSMYLARKGRDDDR